MSERAENLKSALSGKIISLEETSRKRIYIEVLPENLLAVADYIFNQLGARLATASGMEMEKEFEILYHFAFDSEHRLVMLRVRLPKDNPSVPSLANLIKGAEFIEREIYELLGIDFPGHPNLKPLLLPEDWPEGFYPLRRER